MMEKLIFHFTATKQQAAGWDYLIPLPPPSNFAAIIPSKCQKIMGKRAVPQIYIIT
jgi:hypothetical protein